MKRLLAFLLLFAAPAFAQVVPGGASNLPVQMGTQVPGCSIFSIVYINASGQLDCSLTPINGTAITIGRGISTFRDTVTGLSSTSNFWNLTGMLANTAASTESDAVKISIKTPATDSGLITRKALYAEVTPETSGSGKGDSSSVAVYGFSSGETTASLLTRATIGIQGAASAATASSSTLLFGGQFSTVGRAATGNVGVWGHSGQGTAPINGIGVFGESAAASGVAIGGFFKLGSTVENAWPGVTTSAAIAATNVTTAADLMFLTDNYSAIPSSGAAPTFRVLDGAQAQCGNCVLTSSTMTASNQAEMRTVTHAYSWTNAMVVALGAGGTGDINVAVLPAKTRVESALIIIDTPDTSANALTVSCGDTGAGATNYVLAGDAKAAANTIYGDLISGAETGAALFDATAKWRLNYIPSYTATTTVSCRFTKTTTALNTVTGSTGRVILTTTLLP